MSAIAPSAGTLRSFYSLEGTVTDGILSCTPVVSSFLNVFKVAVNNTQLNQISSSSSVDQQKAAILLKRNIRCYIYSIVASVITGIAIATLGLLFGGPVGLGICIGLSALYFAGIGFTAYKIHQYKQLLEQAEKGSLQPGFSV